MPPPTAPAHAGPLPLERLLTAAERLDARRPLETHASKRGVSMKTAASVFVAAEQACLVGGGFATLSNSALSAAAQVSVAQTNRALTVLRASGLLLRQRRRGTSITRLPVELVPEWTEAHQVSAEAMNFLCSRLAKPVGSQIRQDRWQQRLAAVLALGHSPEAILVEATRNHETTHSLVGVIWSRLGTMCEFSQPVHECLTVTGDTEIICDGLQQCDTARVTEQAMAVHGPQVANESWQDDIAAALVCHRNPDLVVAALTEQLENASERTALARSRLQALAAEPGEDDEPGAAVEFARNQPRETFRKHSLRKVRKNPQTPKTLRDNALTQHSSGAEHQTEAKTILAEVISRASLPDEAFSDVNCDLIAEYLAEHPTEPHKLVLALAAPLATAAMPLAVFRKLVADIGKTVAASSHYHRMFREGAHIRNEIALSVLEDDAQRRIEEERSRRAADDARAERWRREDEKRRAYEEQQRSDAVEQTRLEIAANIPADANESVRRAALAIAGRPAEFASHLLSRRMRKDELTGEEAMQAAVLAGFDEQLTEFVSAVPNTENRPTERPSALPNPFLRVIDTGNFKLAIAMLSDVDLHLDTRTLDAAVTRLGKPKSGERSLRQKLVDRLLELKSQ